MKTIDALRQQVRNRLARTWHDSLAGEAASAGETAPPGDAALKRDGPPGEAAVDEATVAIEDAAWPHRFALGQASSAALQEDFGAVQRWALGWRAFARDHGLELTDAARRIGGTQETLPTHVTVPDVDTAARVAGGKWARTLGLGRRRLREIGAAFPEHEAPQRVVRASIEYSDTDFALLCTAARWFRSNPGSGLSPRQVPIEGLHSKWLNSRRSVVLDLAEVSDLGLVEVRSSAVHFTYLDPVYLARNGRRHDSVVPGDRVVPQYEPQVVVISENKDTAILFPALAGGVSVQGHGNAGPSLISGIPFLAEAPHVFYWGDLDAAGLEIVNEYRRFGMDVTTILMDEATLERYASFAAETDARGRPLARSERRELPYLTDSETAVYRRLTDPEGAGPIRLEQERIPLDVAARAVKDALAAGERSSSNP